MIVLKIIRWVSIIGILTCGFLLATAEAHDNYMWEHAQGSIQFTESHPYGMARIWKLVSGEWIGVRFIDGQLHITTPYPTKEALINVLN